METKIEKTDTPPKWARYVGLPFVGVVKLSGKHVKACHATKAAIFEDPIWNGGDYVLVFRTGDVVRDWNANAYEYTHAGSIYKERVWFLRELKEKLD